MKNDNLFLCSSLRNYFFLHKTLKEATKATKKLFGFFCCFFRFFFGGSLLNAELPDQELL
jgi:hypothetical protein